MEAGRNACSSCGEQLSPRWIVCPFCASAAGNASSASIHCVQCRGTLSPDSQKCGNCHAPVVRRYCSGCNRLVPDQTSSCPYCATPSTKRRSILNRYNKVIAASLIAVALTTAAYFASFALKSTRGAPKVAREMRKETPAKAAVEQEHKPRRAVEAQPESVVENDLPATSSANLFEASPSPADQDVPVAVSNSADSGEPLDLMTEGMRLKEGRKLAAIGTQLMKQRKYAEAISVLTSSVETFPPGTRDLTYGIALYRLGQALRLHGKTDEAMPVLKKAMQFAVLRKDVSQELLAANRK